MCNYSEGFSCMEWILRSKLWLEHGCPAQRGTRCHNQQTVLPNDALQVLSCASAAGVRVKSGRNEFLYKQRCHNSELKKSCRAGEKLRVLEV